MFRGAFQGTQELAEGGAASTEFGNIRNVPSPLPHPRLSGPNFAHETNGVSEYLLKALMGTMVHYVRVLRYRAGIGSLVSSPVKLRGLVEGCCDTFYVELRNFFFN